MDATSQRLNKYLALQRGISRREADELIERGAVYIDGVRATLGARLQAGSRVIVNGKTIDAVVSPQYLLLNKPVGYVCSRRAQGEHPTIYDLLPHDYHILKPVGRLDKDSSGLLLLSNDGDFAYQMTHPKFQKVKVYEVELDRPLEPLHQQMVSDYGVQLDDGVSKFTISKLGPASQDDDGQRITYEITMREGRNRQIRRTFAALGYDVARLHRTTFGAYALDGLKSGEHRITTKR